MDIKKETREQEAGRKKELKRLEGLIEENRKKIKELLSCFDILCSLPSEKEALKTASDKLQNGYNGPILIIKGKERDYRWLAKSIEKRLGGDDRGEVFMVFYLKSAEELLKDLNNRDKYL